MDLKAKRTEYQGLLAQARSVVEQFPKGLPAEQKVRVDALMKKAGDLQGEIDAEVKLQETTRQIEAGEKWLSDPVNKVPHGVNGDTDDQKALNRAGWEVKAGVWHKQTSIGVSVPMFAADVLSGEPPTNDPSAALYYRMTKGAMGADYQKAYGQFIRNVATAPADGMAFTMLSAADQKALSEGSDPAGGFLVPPDVQAEMLARLPQMSVMRKYARVQPTSRDVLKWPMVQPHATSASIYSSGFVGGWVGETPAFSDTDPAFGTFDVPIKKLRIGTKLSNDFVADSTVNILAWLAQNGAENMALVEDNGFLTGDGGSLQPLGILNTPGLVTVDVEGSTVDTISNTTAATGSAPKLIDLYYAVPSQYLGGARALLRRAIEGKIRKLIDAQGRFLWPVLSGSGFAPAPNELMGYPKDNSEFMPTDGTNGNKVILFGDISAYVIAQRAQITSIVLRERFADTDQVGIILFERVGGACWNPDALRVGVV